MARNRIQFRVGVRDDASANLQRISKETDKLAGSFKRLAATAISLASITEIARLADTYRLLQNRLKLVTQGSQELKVVTNELVKVSLRSRTSFQSTADLYARVARSSRELGLSQQELIDFTETVSKSITISGSTAQEAAAGVIQFGQALASSRLSGDELRSVLEQMPRLAQAIAEGMGVGIGQLREMGEAGELTATRVLAALRDAGPEIQAEFAQLAPLVSQGFTNLNSAITITIGRLDAAAGFSASLAQAMIDIADQIELMADALTGTLEPTDEMSASFQRLAVGIIGAWTAFQIFKSGFGIGSSRIATSINEAVGATMAQLAVLFEPGGIDEFQAIGDDFNQRWLDIWAVDPIDAEMDAIRMQVIDAMQLMGEIMGGFPRLAPDFFSLDDSDDPAGGLSKKQRDAQQRATDQLQKMKTTILQQHLAFEIAAETGRDYNAVLNEVKIRAAAAAADLVIMGGNIVELNRALEVKQNFQADATALNAIQMELHWLKATEKAAFINLRLQELSKDASFETRIAYAEAAEAIFDMNEKLKATQSFMEKLSEQAARNIQDAFADFLFDPFEEGIKGMLKGFIDVVRRMIAEMLAFQILTSIPGLGTFFSKGLGARADGGPIIAGQPVLVGERGPELFIPHASGRIKNNTATGGSGGEMQFVTNIDARGADPGLIARLPGIMEQRDKQLMLKVQQLVQTGSVSI